MKKFKVHLTRDYVVEILVKNEIAAREFTEQYISGGTDESNETTRLKNSFQIVNIKSTNNETVFVEKI
jgi:hypothetical protein